MNAVHTVTLALALAFSASAHADYLPDSEAAEAALWASPMVSQARGEFAAQSLKSQGLQHGHAEWAVSADVAQRRIQTTPRESQAEWGVALSRPLRLPAVAAADRTLASALTAHAEANLGEALHESGRQLLTLWFDWLSEASQTQMWQAQLKLAEQQLEGVNARIRLGESPRAERVNAEAALAQVRLQQQQAGLRMQQAQSRLLAQFPALPLPPDQALPQPVPPAGSADAYVAAVLEHNHELARARRQADVRQAEARQLAKRRNADPSVGVFYKNEVGGDEHVLGLNVGLTLPGAARRYNQQAAAQLSSTAQDAAMRLEQQLRQEARADFEAAVTQAANWQQAERVAQALEESARLAARAYSLGEGNLDQVLLTRRLALDGRVQAQQAQVAALAADARLKLDAHALWPLDVHADDAHAHP
ncbi:MAG: TolC family protein [Thiobacillus sp.]